MWIYKYKNGINTITIPTFESPFMLFIIYDLIAHVKTNTVLLSLVALVYPYLFLIINFPNVHSSCTKSEHLIC